MKIQLNETVNAPVEKVFGIFSDFHRAAERVDGIESIEVLTDGPIGVGTKFRETRIMFGKSSTEEMEVTSFEPNQSYTVEADSCGAHFQTLFHFRPEGDHTLVEMEMQTRADTLFAKLMSPLGFLMAGTMKKCIQSDITELKHHCENEMEV